MIALGIIIAIVALALSVTASLIGYFKARRKFASAKWAVEAITVGIVVLISIAIKVILCLSVWKTTQAGADSLKGFFKGFTAFIEAIYVGVGALTFGDPMDTVEINLWLRGAYYLSTVYAGFVILCVITAKASYETYSWVRKKLMSFRKDKRDIYVFTALTEGTLTLARSIQAHADEEKAEGRGKRDPIILFAGDGIEPFSRRNDLCKEVMKSGFLYWSSPKRTDEKSIADALGLDNKNGEDYDTRFCIFAFESEGDVPLEEKNFDTVIADVAKRVCDKKDKRRIAYYVLTKREVNYQSYNAVYQEAVEKALDCVEIVAGDTPKQIEDKKKSALQKAKEKAYVAAVWNEADVVARQVGEFVQADAPAASRENVLVWTIGFANTGRAMTKELYVHTAGFDESGKTTTFTADIFEKRHRDHYGLFRLENPMAICVSAEDAARRVRGAAERADAYFTAAGRSETGDLCRRILTAYESGKEQTSREDDRLATVREEYERGGKQAGDEFTATFNKETCFPTYRFHDLSATERDFAARCEEAFAPDGSEQRALREIEAYARKLRNGDDEEKTEGEYLKQAIDDYKQKVVAPDFVTISTGDDYLNVKLANALASTALYGKTREDGKYVTIFVKIADDKNNALLCPLTGKRQGNVVTITKALGGVERPVVKIVAVGNVKDMYAYAYVVDDEADGQYSVNYDQAYAMMSKADWYTAATKAIKAYYASGKASLTDEGKRALDDMKEETKKVCKARGGDRDVYLKKLAGDDLWSKTSNREAALFAPTFLAAYERAKKTSDFDESLFLCDMLRLEHERWTRLHVANGWVYGAVKKKPARIHTCLLPIGLIDDEYFLYDVINAVWGIVSGKK